MQGWKKGKKRKQCVVEQKEKIFKVSVADMLQLFKDLKKKVDWRLPELIEKFTF